MTKLVWRLQRRPEPMEVIDLLKAGIIEKDEARKILFREKEDEEITTARAMTINGGTNHLVSWSSSEETPLEI